MTEPTRDASPTSGARQERGARPTTGARPTRGAEGTAAVKPTPAAAPMMAGEVPGPARDRLRQFVRIWLGLSAAGGALAIVSAFLPWVALRAGEVQTISGIETGGDGLITGGLGLLVLGLAARGWVRPEGPGRRTGTIILIAGFFILSIPAIDWADFRRTMFAVDATIAALATPEPGLYGTALGGLLAIIGGWQLRRVLKMQSRIKTG